MGSSMSEVAAEGREQYEAWQAETSDPRRHAGAEVTLDGQPATICGRLNDFATVATLPNGPRYEYAWATVEYVMGTGGAFKS